MRIQVDNDDDDDGDDDDSGDADNGGGGANAALKPATVSATAASNHTLAALRTNPKSPLGSVHQQTLEQDEDSASNASSEDEQQQLSIVRQNLLGPLTFDDLYYT